MKKNKFWCGFVVLMFLVGGGSQVWAAAPVADFTASPTTGPGRLTVAFTDASTNDPTEWLWDFGDGSDPGIDQNPSHQYSNAGTYTVSLTATNIDGSSDPMIKTDYITVTTKVDFYTRRGASGSGPFTVDFRDDVSGDVDPASYTWDFGDAFCDPSENTSTDTDPRHVYSHAGTYTVSLTATGLNGTFTEIKSDYITVSTGAGMSFYPQAGKAPVTPNFASDSSTDVTSWTWDFGDGRTSTVQNPGNVTYATPGMYTVTLTVMGDTGEVTSTGVVVAADPWTKTVTKLASAEPDECFNGMGERVDPLSTDPLVCPDPDPETGLPMPMTNQTYTWSLTEVDNATNHSLWFGTGGNVLCTTQGALISEVGAGGYGSGGVCEFGENPIIDEISFLGYYPQLADWRRANIYRYDLDSGELIDKTPPDSAQGIGLFNICLGLRSAGSHNGVVFLAGGTFEYFGQGIVMFAYNAVTGEYLGAHAFPAYRTVRKWKVIQDHLYLGVGLPTDLNSTSIWDLGAGRILKWVGDLSNPFQFIEVGNMPNLGFGGPAFGGVVRELTEYIDGNGNSRIAGMAKGVWLSPPIPEGGLTESDYNDWDLVWSPAQYEPDEVTLNTYVGGGIEFLNGWLYFMTMHIPGNAADAHRICDIAPLDFDIFGADICFGAGREPEELTSSEYNAVYSNVGRSTSVWRIKNAESASNRVTQLLYGEAQLPKFTPGKYDPDNPELSQNPYDAFTLVDNVGHYTPLLGSSGFNNSCNNYGWVMQVVGDNLFAGTMDYCTLYRPNTSIDPENYFSLYNGGADIWRISGGAGDNLPTVLPETTSAFKGFDNAGTGPADVYTYMPYGIRTLAKSSDGTKLFVGTASGNNLAPEGEGNGWSLLQLDSIAPLSCDWDIEPVENDYDVDGLDLAAAANQPIPSAELGVFAQQFGHANCAE